MRDKQQYKTVTIEYCEPRRKDWIDLVTDVEYHPAYVRIRYYDKLDRLDTKIITMNNVDNIIVEDMSTLDAEKAKMYAAERTAGTDFEKIRFFPYNDEKAKVTIFTHRSIDATHFEFDRVKGIERKWNHDLRGYEIRITNIHEDAGLVWSGIDCVYIFDERDVKAILIERTGMKDIKVNVNGGKYEND